MKKNTLRAAQTGNAGMALVTALIFIAVSTMLVTSLMARYIQQRVVVDRFEDYYIAFDAAEAALERCRIVFETGSPGSIGLDDWTPQYGLNGALVLPDFDDPAITPATLLSNPEVEYIGFTVNWFGNGQDSNGDGIVDSEAERGMFSIHAAARQGGTVRRVESVYASADVNVWNNAIFAGAGQAGGLINGNVSIHGSVHLLGNNIPEGGVAVTAIDMSGTALINNTYAGIPNDLRVRVPALPRRLYNGEMADTLNAKLRVKRGLVGMSGNAHIGQPWVAGSGIKGPMDGTYVNQGWTGNSVTNDGGRGIPDPSRFYSDNGHTVNYDLGDRVPMPMLSDDWREPDGTRVMNPNTGTWYTHNEYFTEVLLADPTVRTDGIRTGNIVLNARSQTNNAVYWNSTTETYLTGAAALAATPAPGDSYLWFDPMNNVLHINGQVRINGSLTFTGQGNQTTINYSGRGAFLVDGNVTIDADLLACNNGNPANTANSFPVNNVIGIMATGDMMVGQSAQLSIMGAFYAQGSISTQRQTNIIGTFVSNFFNMGTNVPSIFQVPELANNLPYGMIGNYPIRVLQRASWREVGI